MIVGQDKLLEKLNNLNIDSFPRSSIIVGKKGSGKHTILNYIKDNIINFPIIDITECISDEYIDNIYRNSLPNIYYVDINKMTEKEQNILLKLVEEPLKNAYIILLCENKNSVLNTILNRCLVFELAEYNKKVLYSFLKPEEENKELLTSILDTPGKLIDVDAKKVLDTYKLCDTISYKMNAANFSNALTIVDKINYKDEYNKFDFNIFLDSLNLSLFSKYLKDNDNNTLNMYLFVVRQREKLLDQRINKQIFMQNLITRLWKLSRGMM